MTTENTVESTGKQQARAQVRSIGEMVAALNVDFDRLEELRSDRRRYARSIDGPPEEDTPENWAIDNPEDAEELAELVEAAGECENQDEARQRITEDALSVGVRSGWASLGETLTPEEFRIVLCTGGPHVEIVGELDDNNQPDRVRILYRDWGDSGELFDFDRDVVLTYCQQFYFGE